MASTKKWIAGATKKRLFPWRQRTDGAGEFRPRGPGDGRYVQCDQPSFPQHEQTAADVADHRPGKTARKQQAARCQRCKQQSVDQQKDFLEILPQQLRPSRAD